MKTNKKFGTLVKSVASVLVLGGFIWLLAASLEVFTLVTKKPLGDGSFEETVTALGNLGPWKMVTTGREDNNGFWTGPVSIVEHWESEGVTSQTVLNGSYFDGNRHGIWTRKFEEHEPEYIQYDQGKEITHWKRGKTDAVAYSAFDILMGKHYLFLKSLEMFGLTGDEIKIYTDSLEAGLSRQDFVQSGFESAYSSVSTDLDEYPEFDSLSNAVAALAHYNGMYNIKKHDVRLAVLNRNRAGSGTTHAVVDSKYPGYLDFMNDNLVTDAEFEAFCHEIDSTMDTYGPLNREDSLFIDSVDTRLYRAISTMGSASSAFGPGIASGASASSKPFKTLRNMAGAILHGMQGLKTSSDNALNVYLNDVYTMYGEADVVKVSVREACFANKQWVQLPVVTTGYSGANSMTSVTIQGSVLESGGAVVTSRGIAWADTYNPTVENHVVVSGDGTGIFDIVIDGLEPGKIYYTRSFAINSAGTAYGNCIEFTTERASSTDPTGSDPFSAVIYPNPAFDGATLLLTANQPGVCRFTLMTLDGRIVYQREIRHSGQGLLKVELDLSLIASGIYWCRVTNGTSTAVIRLLKTE